MKSFPLFHEDSFSPIIMLRTISTSLFIAAFSLAQTSDVSVTTPTLWDPTLDWPAVTLNQPEASTSTVPPNVDFAPTCDLSPDACPACDGWWHFTSAGGNEYVLHCGSIVSPSSTYYPDVIAANGSLTAACIALCNSYDTCTGATVIERSTCGLTLVASPILTDFENATAYLRVARTAVPSSTSLSPPSSSTIIEPAPPGTSDCAVNHLSCPHCDLGQITTSNGRIYKVLCGSMLFSVRAKSPDNPTSIEECLLHCDQTFWCAAANWWQDNCIMALGANFKSSPASDWIAFEPIASNGSYKLPPVDSLEACDTETTTTPYDISSTSSIPDWQQMSAFPTGVFTSAPFDFSVPIIPLPTGLLPLPIPLCMLDSPTCPSCNLVPIEYQDMSARITCDRAPICYEGLQDATTATSIYACLAECNSRHLCTAGYFDPILGTCEMCEGRSAGGEFRIGVTGFYVEPREYDPIPEQDPYGPDSESYSWAVGPARTFDGPWDSIPSLLTSLSFDWTTITVPSLSIGPLTAATSSQSSQLILPSSTTATLASPLITNPSAVQCPDSDHALLELGSRHLDYRVLCNVIPDSSGAFVMNPFDNFTQCVNACEQFTCWAFSWNPDEKVCLFYESLERWNGRHPLTVWPQPGITAGGAISSTSDLGIVTGTRTSTIKAPSDVSTTNVPTSVLSSALTGGLLTASTISAAAGPEEAGTGP